MARRADISQKLADHQFNRAARWLRNHTRADLPPPRHINEKINAQRTFLAEAVRSFNAREVA